MSRKLADADQTPSDLRGIVKWSVALLGNVIEDEAGEKLFQLIESLRGEMAQVRDREDPETQAALASALPRLQKLNKSERLLVARSFTLMLELINVCENAYRSYRLSENLRQKNLLESAEAGNGAEKATGLRPEAIIYVLTAHPTEARSPESIAVFRGIQKILIEALTGESARARLKSELSHGLRLAWKVHVFRETSPQVTDEAEHIYSTLFERDILISLLDASYQIVPVYLRTWVGGDKDGHPGVDEKVMQQSLALSRVHLLQFIESQLLEIQATISILPSSSVALGLRKGLSEFTRTLALVRTLKAGDGARVTKLQKGLERFSKKYESEVGSRHPILRRLGRLLHLFPGLVVPLECRESSEILMGRPKNLRRLAIYRMLETLAKLSKGGDPLWYARGLIVSMASSVEHLRAADFLVRRAFGRPCIPVIPLFEQVESLDRAPEVMLEFIRDPKLGKNIRQAWGGDVEIMVGYSDSAKEAGVFPSRLAVASAMNQLDRLCTSEGVRPVFFQGSGGSVDRGGGAVQDQTAWWPRSALQVYKVTIQGEMVERSLSSPEITRGQIARIASSASESLEKTAQPPHLPVLRVFASAISAAYRKMIHDPEFLKIVEKATPYPDLSELRIGSRPTRRAQQLSVQGLRAIPWVLCWTQIRVLFPTWWGVGSAWKNADSAIRADLKKAYFEEPVYASYVKALGFTLAKVELAVWKNYLDRSGLEDDLRARFFATFSEEFELALEFVRHLSGSPDPVWFRPWLGASIRLRSPMIHPLNLLQIIAVEERDFALLRCTVTGIASGMLTTG